MVRRSLRPFPVPQVDLPLLEVEILDPQLQCFQQPEAAAVQQSGDQAGRAIQTLQNSPHLRRGQHYRQALGALRTDQLVHPLQLALEDVGVEEEQGGQSLVLGAGADPAGGGEGGQERAHFGLGHRVRVALAVEQDEVPDPSDVSGLGARAEVAQPRGRSNPVHQPRWRGRFGPPRIAPRT
jgi:hypothetical protein